MTAAQQSSAKRMIAAKGQDVTIKPKTYGGYNTTTGRAFVDSVSQTGKGVILPLRQGFQPQSGSPAGDMSCYLSALDNDGADLNPVVNDILVNAAGTAYTIAAVATIAPAGLAIMHELVLRGHE